MSSPGRDDDEHWVDISVIGDAYEVQMEVEYMPTEYRHRTASFQIPGSMDSQASQTEWTPGLPPDWTYLGTVRLA